MTTYKAMLPSDHIKKGFYAVSSGGASAAYSVSDAICAFLDYFHDDDSDAYWEKFLLWAVFVHEQVERLFPDWLARWHAENGDEETCCYPQDLVDAFREEHTLEDCVQVLDINTWTESDWELGLTKRPTLVRA